jgi:prefoldin subunit 5
MAREQPDEFLRHLQDIVERLEHLRGQLATMHKSNKELLKAINANPKATNELLRASER